MWASAGQRQRCLVSLRPRPLIMIECCNHRSCRNRRDFYLYVYKRIEIKQPPPFIHSSKSTVDADFNASPNYNYLMLIKSARSFFIFDLVDPI